MHAVNMLQAKSNLSRLVEAIELGDEREIIIARNGRPVAKADLLVSFFKALYFGLSAQCVDDF